MIKEIMVCDECEKEIRPVQDGFFLLAQFHLGFWSEGKRKGGCDFMKRHFCSRRCVETFVLKRIREVTNEGEDTTEGA